MTTRGDDGMAGECARRTRLTLAVVLACCLAVGLLLPAPVTAGDSNTVFSLEPDEVDVDSGGTVTLDLVASDHGDDWANGIDELSATIAYDPDVFEVTAVEHGPMLATGDPGAEVEGTIDVDEDAGTIAVDQERTPSGDGARGTETAATITLAVAEDVGPTSETIEIADASTVLVTDYPQATFERDATIHVDGGDETADEEDDDGPDGVTLADDGGAVDDLDGTPDDTAESSADDTGTTTADGDDAESDSIAGFSVPAAIVGLALGLWVAGRRT